MLTYDTTLEIWKKEFFFALNHVFILMPIWKIKTQIAKKIPNYTNVHLEGQMSLVKELDKTLENSQRRVTRWYTDIFYLKFLTSYESPNSANSERKLWKFHEFCNLDVIPIGTNRMQYRKYKANEAMVNLWQNLWPNFGSRL